METSSLVDLTTYNMVFQTKTYASLVSALPKSISDKRAAKKQKSLPKIVFLHVGTTVCWQVATEERKKWGETLNYVSCFSLHFFRALAASCVLYNRTEHSQSFSIC